MRHIPYWEGLESEFFDLVMLARFLAIRLPAKDFAEALHLLIISESNFQALLSYLERGEIERRSHSVSPHLEKGEPWTNTKAIHTFLWIHRFLPNTQLLLNSVLKLARMIGATPEEIFEAARVHDRFREWTLEDWRYRLYEQSRII